MYMNMNTGVGSSFMSDNLVNLRYFLPNKEARVQFKSGPFTVLKENI